MKYRLALRQMWNHREVLLLVCKDSYGHFCGEGKPLRITTHPKYRRPSRPNATKRLSGRIPVHPVPSSSGAGNSTMEFPVGSLSLSLCGQFRLATRKIEYRSSFSYYLCGHFPLAARRIECRSSFSYYLRGHSLPFILVGK